MGLFPKDEGYFLFLNVQKGDRSHLTTPPREALTVCFSPVGHGV